MPCIALWERRSNGITSHGQSVGVRSTNHGQLLGSEGLSVCRAASRASAQIQPTGEQWELLAEVQTSCGQGSEHLAFGGPGTGKPCGTGKP